MNKSNIKLNLKELFPIFEGITDAVFIDNADGHCIWCNSACEHLYKISSADIVGKHVAELETLGIFAPSVSKRILEEEREITIIHENKHGKKLLTTGTPVFNDEILTFIITTSRDITKLTETKGDTSLPANTSMLSSTDEYPSIANTNIISSSAAMENVLLLTLRLASVNSTVLITGESGVGKGVIAKLLHDEGNRCDAPFITVNCGAIPETLIESELFGYVSGAFTGSRSGGKQGLFEAAQNGTIFLDEISELSINLQVKLLRVIQEREITPVGGVKSIPIDVRVVSATNKNLMNLVREGKFREDLYHRLNVVPINIPSLRERLDDILPLIKINLKKYNESLHEHKTLSSEALTTLIKYPWPGNIRELQNIIERLILTTPGDIITEKSLPVFLKKEAETNTSSNTELSLVAGLEKAEKEILEAALKTYKSTRAIAKVLQVSQPTIVRKLNKYGLGEKK